NGKFSKAYRRLSVCTPSAIRIVCDGVAVVIAAYRPSHVEHETSTNGINDARGARTRAAYNVGAAKTVERIDAQIGSASSSASEKRLRSRADERHIVEQRRSFIRQAAVNGNKHRCER